MRIMMLLLWLGAMLAPVHAAEVWVAPDGDDTAAGSETEPMQTLNMAMRKARELRRTNDPSAAAGIEVILKPGVYQLYEPLLVRPEDSGTPMSPTVVRAADMSNPPVVSGGVAVTGWQKLEGALDGLPDAARGKVWSAPMPKVSGRDLEFRQMWVENAKAVRAAEPDLPEMHRILAVDKKAETLTIPKTDLKINPNQTPIEFVIHQCWAIANLRVKSIEQTAAGSVLRFYNPESRVEFEHPWPPIWIHENFGNSAFYITNSIQCLDQPGEWYLDTAHRQVIYWPREGEDMATASVTVPALETLVRVDGNVDRPVHDVHFVGLGFQHTTWMRPSLQGHVPLQAGMYMTDAYKIRPPIPLLNKGLENQAWIGRPPAGVEVRGAHDLTIERCRFERMASSGLDVLDTARDITVRGNLLRDIGGNGIVLGAIPDGGFETHVPFDPQDDRVLVQDVTVANNLIDGATNEDWGCVGILTGYVRDTMIEHNELRNLSYSGISLGWGWTYEVNAMRENIVRRNYIHRFAKHMYDIGGVYTLSNQPGSRIYENRIEDLLVAPYAHDPKHRQYLYLDEGSNNMSMHDNWTAETIDFSNTKGRYAEFRNNGPEVSEDIKNAAGLEPAFSDLNDIE